MAKVEIKNLKSVLNSVQAVFEKSLQTEKLDDIKDFLVNRVQSSTRAGKDLSREGAPQPDLSPGYIRMREKILESKSIKVDSKFFRVDRSNLTLTGQMLESLKGLVKPRNREIEIFVDGTRNDGKSNSEVAKDLAKRGRTFLGIDTLGIKRVRKMILDELRRQIRLRK